jgi:hypothetical protein
MVGSSSTIRTLGMDGTLSEISVPATFQLD